VAEFWSLDGKRMGSVSENYIEMRRKCVAEVVAIACSVLAWAFIIALVLFWSQIGDYVSFFCDFYAFAGVWWVCGSIGFLLFVRMAEDSPETRFSRVWLLCSGFGIVLLPLLVCLKCITFLFWL
jgi:hypothetical protein